jgi:hypothetical protein
MPEPVFRKLGIDIMATEPISLAYFLNPSHQSVCLYINSLIIARQGLSKNITGATSTHPTVEELLGHIVFNMVHVV